MSAAEDQERGPDAVPDKLPVVELRHIAGLTAGQTLPLSAGRFRFGPLRSDHGGLVAGTPDVVSFDLTIGDDGDAVLTAGEETVAVEGVIIDQPIVLADGDVVQLATDHFMVESIPGSALLDPVDWIEPRSIAPLSRSAMKGWFFLFTAATVLGVALAFVNPRLIGVSLLGLAGMVGTLLVRQRRNERAHEARAVAIDNARLLLFAEIASRRKAEAEIIRAQALTPAVIAERAADRSEPPAQGLPVTIASGDQPWDPPVHVSRSPGWDHRSVVDELSFLPAIPYSVDLDAGPIAVIGPRAATLAVARHIITTATCLGVPNTGADLETEVPADWRWLLDQPSPALRILDHVAGQLGPRTVVLQSSADELTASGFDLTAVGHLMEISENGTAEITTPDGVGTGFVPHGITETHARELQELLAQRASSVDLEESGVLDLTLFDSDRLLVTGPNRARHRDVLATAAVHQADLHPDRPLYILDRGDRALIRLAQLDNCIRYTTIDQIEAVEEMVEDLADLIGRPAIQPGLLLAPDLWATVDFYRVTDHHELAHRIDRLISQMQVVPVAASASTATTAEVSSFLVWIETSDGTTAEVRKIDGGGVIDLDSLPGSDLTGSVARLTTLRREETRS